MFRITDSRGFQLSFENGLTISVQFGTTNYCKNRHLNLQPDSDIACNTAEVAVFPTNGDGFITNKFLPKYRGLDVVGWVKADEVATLIRRVKMYKSK